MRYLLILMCYASLLTLQAQETITYSNTKVGDILPDLELKNIDNFPKTKVKLSELGQQLLIIDFWATWCGPCIAKIPRMDSIMKALPNELLFLSVSDEPKEKVRTFLEKKEMDMGTKLVMPSITEDIRLSKLFPHYFVPHYVWIKLPERKVIAITRGEEIRFDKIKSVLLNSGNAQMFTTKIDKVLDYDISEPLFPYLAQNDSIIKNSFKQYSFLTSYIPNLTGGMYSTEINGDTTKTVRFVMKNVSIKTMAARAFGEGFDFWQDNSIDIEVKEPSQIYTLLEGNLYQDWLSRNSFCYEIKIDKKNKDRLYNIMRNDLVNYFPQYNFKVEPRKKDSWVLITTGNNNTLRSRGGSSIGNKSGNKLTLRNSEIKWLIMALRYPYFLYSPILIADQSNIDFKVDIEIEPKSFTDINEVNSELAKYNLKFERRVEFVNVLVIKDN